MTAAEMTDALAQINDRLADAARAKGSAAVTFCCECGDCLAAEVPLSLVEHEEIRAREDLVFAPGHEAPRRYRRPLRTSAHTNGSSRGRRAFEAAGWRDLLTTDLIRVAEHG